MKCTVENCKKIAYGNTGICKMHYERRRRHGDVHKLNYSVNQLNSKTHGMCGTKIYRTWLNMKNRCNGKHPHYRKYYSDRGIKVCKRWQNSFENFLEDMGLPPTKNHTIDRVNNNGNYTPKNCRWATRKQQQNNMRHNRLITFNNESCSIAEWSRRTKIKSSAIIWRLNHGWSVEKSLMTRIKS